MIAALSSGVPPTSVYLVFDAAIARTTASHTFGGVSKSGSPWVSAMMSRPAARSSRARWPAMELGDGLMRFRRAAMMLTRSPGRRSQKESSHDARDRAPAVVDSHRLYRLNRGSIYALEAPPCSNWDT